LDANRGRTILELPQRLMIAREGRMEELREIIDTGTSQKCAAVPVRARI